jgi:cell wall-associated NlpC family hydrolase
MIPFVSTPEDAARVKAAAESWRGTPYIGDGAVKGTGCSCSMLPYEIMREAGFTVPTPPARGRLFRCQIMDAMIEWLTSHEGTHFRKLGPDEEHAIGDVMLFNAGMGHLALNVGGGNVIHSLQNQGARIETYRSKGVVGRLVGVWRPIISE